MSKPPTTVPRAELAWVIEFPIPCGNCGKEFSERVGSFVDKTGVVCPGCEAELDLATHQWTVVRDQLRKLCIGKHAPFAPVKKL